MPHRWAQKKDWSAYPWREVVEVRPLWQFGHHFIETLACGHDGKAMLYPWQQARRRRCIQCPPRPKRGKGSGMGELQSAYEAAEARAIELAKAAVKAARREMEEYDNLRAAARAVVEDATETFEIGPTPLYTVDGALLDALRAAVEAADR